MATTTPGGTGPARSALTFDEFVDAALGAAIRAAAKHGQTAPGTKPGQLPFPIWVGIIAGPIGPIGQSAGGNISGG